ncbi:MAG: acyl-CoA synthetase (AMP-forming)/AMP-acid ligase II, partial [Polaribacter sp.]
MNIGFIPAKTARLEPAREALIDVHSGRRISFGQLDENICRLANGFVDQLGLSKGDRVAVLSKNAIEYMEVYYACARVGLIAQPINWRLGTDEIVRILEDGSPSVVISSDEYLEQIKQLKDKVIVAHWLNFGANGDGSYGSLLQASPSTEPPSSADVGGDDPVLILYTGGTTGQSKGALHTHRSLSTGMINQTVAERIVPADVYMLTGQMFHIP